MSDYTPTREQLADTIYDALEEGGWVTTSGHYPYEVADAVMPLLADAWEEGRSAGWAEDCAYDAPNPYRQEDQ